MSFLLTFLNHVIRGEMGPEFLNVGIDSYFQTYLSLTDFLSCSSLTKFRTFNKKVDTSVQHRV